MFVRLLFALGLLLLFPAKGRAQPLPDAAPIRGQVVDETGHPIPSAVLIIRRQDDTVPTAFWGAEARAGGDGRFVVPEAEEGRYLLSAEAPGFAPTSDFPLDWNARSAPVRVRMAHLTLLRLRVLAPDGAPLRGAPLWIRLRAVETGGLPLRVHSDENGEVALPNIVPATYFLVVVAASGIATQSALAANPSTKTPLEVRLREGATLRVHALDANGTALGGAALSAVAASLDESVRLAGSDGDPGENWALAAASGAPQALVSRDGDGELELRHLPAGRFSARLSLPGQEVQTRDFVFQDGQTQEWNAGFPARRAATLSLRVVDERGQPVPGALVALRLLPLAVNGTFDNDPFAMPDSLPDPFASPASGARVARTDAAGNLSLFPLRAGRFRVFASRPAPDSWLRAPVAPEGAPTDVVVSLSGPNAAQVQVP